MRCITLTISIILLTSILLWSGVMYELNKPSDKQKTKKIIGYMSSHFIYDHDYFFSARALSFYWLNRRASYTYFHQKMHHKMNASKKTRFIREKSQEHKDDYFVTTNSVEEGIKMKSDVSVEKRRIAQRKERQREEQYNILASLDWKSAGSLFIVIIGSVIIYSLM